MATPGGKRKAPGRSAPAGPGRFSRRDEGVQPIREPDIDQMELNYGDRQMLTEAQRIAKLPTGERARPRGAPRPTGMPTARAGGLPPFVFDSPSAFPQEPPTAGLDGGPGAGSEALQMSTPPDDVREQVLNYLANNYGNPDAQQILRQLQAERAAAAAAAPMAPAGRPALTAPAEPVSTPAPAEAIPREEVPA